LIAFLKKRVEIGLSAKRVVSEDITVGAWLEKFYFNGNKSTDKYQCIKKQGLFSKTFKGYKSYYNTHIKGDPLAKVNNHRQRRRLECRPLKGASKPCNNFPVNAFPFFMFCIDFRIAFYMKNLFALPCPNPSCFSYDIAIRT